MNETKIELAIIIPVYNEEKMLVQNFEAIKKILVEDGIACSFMFIDDGSADQTWAKLLEIEAKHENVNSIRFSRNFGKEIAICAGLDSIDAEKYIIMDSDLQHPPRYIKELLRVMEEEGADLVEGVKMKRGKETLKYKVIAKGFYKFLRSFTGLELDNSSDFKLMKFSVVEALREFEEASLFFRGLVNWVGFKKTVFPFEVEERLDGTTRFSTRKLIQLAFTAILSHTSKPLHLTIFGGVVFLIFAVILGLQTLYNFFAGNSVSGFSTVILLLLFTGSMIMLSLGIIGIYIARIYEEVKERPRYIISDRVIK